MGDAAHGNLELHAVKVGVLAMLSVTYLGVTVCFVGIIFWESFFDSFRLWVSELSGWERLGGVEKVSVFWQKGEISTATLRRSDPPVKQCYFRPSGRRSATRPLAC